MFGWFKRKLKMMVRYLEPSTELPSQQMQDLITSNLNLQEEVFTLQDTVRSMADYLGFTIEDGVAQPKKDFAAQLASAAARTLEANEERILLVRTKLVLKMIDEVARRRCARRA